MNFFLLISTTLFSFSSGFLYRTLRPSGISRALKSYYDSSVNTVNQEFDIICLKKDLKSLIDLSRNENRESEIMEKVKQIESIASPGTDVTPLYGIWDLIYANDDRTRSSPFFWAFRKAFNDSKIQDPLGILGTNSFAEGIFKITDNIPVKSIGFARQYITNDVLVSQVEVKIQRLPIEGRSLMTTTSNWKITDPENPFMWEIKVDKTEVKESTIGKLLPILEQLARPFPSGQALDLIRPGSSTVWMKHIYVDDELRISKNVLDDKYFVFQREEQS